ncbi:hypothetical protein CLU79DRAFT_800394 [Phycomyces nitens]|nr:hypothetical protein CLU79DRAFT_800394 [Phycomyces nitens]
MLHVQESVNHGNILLANMIPGPIIHPQPSTSNSRSAKVIGQLQATLDNLQNELTTAHTQLDAARQAKRMYESQSHHYLETNQDYRANIQDLMQVLTSKQAVVATTKTASTDLEARVKHLKTEAMTSRKQLEDLRKRELVLENDRNTTVAEKALVERQQNVFRESVGSLENRFERETGSIYRDLELIQQHIYGVTSQSEQWAKCLEKQIRTDIVRRSQQVREIQASRLRLKANTHYFIERVQKDLQRLMESINQSIANQDSPRQTVEKYKKEMEAMSSRINSYATHTSYSG